MLDSANSHKRLKNILIVGGGSSGWMTAAAFAKALGTQNYNITLVESDEIGTVGVGEATIPHIIGFNQILGLDEDEFLRRTNGSFKLGIEFVNWKEKGHKYMHPFGTYGMNIGPLTFFNYWLKLKAQGKSNDAGEYALAAQTAWASKFMRPKNVPNSPLSKIKYAYHFDASLYAKFLREYAEALGVVRIQGKIKKVNLREGDGFIESVVLDSEKILHADFFIDCSGFRGLLIEQALKTGYDDWSHLLLCDTAIAVPSENITHPDPFTRATAHSAGWQWRIPLQHRTGNGHVFSSRYMSTDEATSILLNNLDGPTLAEPKTISFKTGMRRKFWNKNCVAIGLSSGFIEPLESTSIHLIQTSITRLISFFPSGEINQVDIDKYNSISQTDLLLIRDFIILHYKATHRNDSDFWNHCRTMDIPENLKRKIELFRKSGRIYRDNNELFAEDSWFAVMEGQGIIAEDYHPLVDSINDNDFDRYMKEIKRVIDCSVDVMPSHIDFINEHCSALKNYSAI